MMAVVAGRLAHARAWWGPLQRAGHSRRGREGPAA